MKPLLATVPQRHRLPLSVLDIENWDLDLEFAPSLFGCAPWLAQASARKADNFHLPRHRVDLQFHKVVIALVGMVLAGALPASRDLDTQSSTCPHIVRTTCHGVNQQLNV
jgi:hypothetical protein